MPAAAAGPERALDTEILNRALEMATDLYASGFQSVRHRLHWHYLSLAEPELDAYDRACSSAAEHAYGRVRDFWHYDMTAAQWEEARVAWEAAVLERHPWISPQNLRRLWANELHSWK